MKEFLSQEDIQTIQDELLNGFAKLKKFDRIITVYGSSRIKESSSYHQDANTIGRMIAKNGFATVTGGGPGIMNAVASGARDAGGDTFGCNIKLPFEQIPSAANSELMEFRYFFTRKIILSVHSDAFIILPGGFGTLDELAEILTLMQTGKRVKAPIFVYGADFWKPLKTWFEKTLVIHKTISPGDLDLITWIDSIPELEEKLNEL